MFGNEFKGVVTPVFIMLPVLIFGMRFQVLIVPVVDILPVLTFVIVVGATGNGVGIIDEIQIVHMIASTDQNIITGDISPFLFFFIHNKIQLVWMNNKRYKNTIISPIHITHSLMSMIQKIIVIAHITISQLKSILSRNLIRISTGNRIIIHQNQSEPERLVMIQRMMRIALSIIEKFIYYEWEV